MTGELGDERSRQPGFGDWWPARTTG